MWFSSWLAKGQRSTTSGRSRTPSRKRPSFRPRLEALEDRWLPSQVGLMVTSLADSGSGTLRTAILTADAGSHSDKFTIGFAVTGTIDLQALLPIPAPRPREPLGGQRNRAPGGAFGTRGWQLGGCPGGANACVVQTFGRPIPGTVGRAYQSRSDRVRASARHAVRVV